MIDKNDCDDDHGVDKMVCRGGYINLVSSSLDNLELSLQEDGELF